MKKWVLVFASSYILAALMVLADPDFAFTGRFLHITPVFNLVVWTSAIVNGLTAGFLLWRMLVKRDAVLAIVTALPVACFVGFVQLVALPVWTIGVIYYFA